MPVLLHIVVAAASHAGQVRHSNQDAWSYSLDTGVFVVCDGMGGAAGGEIASRAATEAFLEHLATLNEAQRTPEAIMQAVGAANRRVYGRAAQEPALHGMGTTLVGLVAHGEHEVAVVHVGDSRCYRWRGGELKRCTEDHSLMAEQLRMGVLTEEEAAQSPMRNVITRAVGTRPAVEPEIRMLPVEPGDVFLLCSDGLTRELGDAQIAEVLARKGQSLEEKNTALLQAALAAGGRDNITTLLLKMGEGHRYKQAQSGR